MEKELEETIKISGNNLHIDTIKILESLEEKSASDWKIKLNSYYYDDTANKPREIDIVAEQEVPVFDFGDITDEFKVNLFIECKYFPSEIAFRMFPPEPQNIEDAILVEQFNKVEILYDTSFKAKHHHFQLKSIGQLYDTIQVKREQERMFNAITQPIKSYVFFKEHLEDKGISYLLTVYDGISGIYQIPSNYDLNKLNSLKPEKISTIGVNYSYRIPQQVIGVPQQQFNRQYFLIDFVHKNELENYLKNKIYVERDELREVLKFQRILKEREKSSP